MLEEFDALVGCGVWMFPDNVIENIGVLSTVEKNAVCVTLFYVTNWCLELINSFSTLEGEEIKKKVLVRLKQVLKLKELISVILKHNPMFRPPTALFCEDTSDWSPVQTQDGKKGKGKKSKPKVTETMMNAKLNLNTQRT